MADLFNVGTSNNAPPPVPGGFGNPTGANTGQYKSPMASGFPSFPALGPIAQSTSAPNTSGLNAGGPYAGAPNSGLMSLSTGITPTSSTLQGNQLREYQRAYGKGTGQAIFDMMQKGLFNPQVAQAMLAAQQPGIQRGQADILNAFGRSGSRFSSAAALGLGDYNSQVQLNQGQLLAGMYQNAQSEQLNFLGNTLGTLHTEEANNGGGWIDDLVGGLEVAGGIGLSAFGMPQFGIPLITGGAGTIAGQGQSGKNSPQPQWNPVPTPSPAIMNDSNVPAFPQAMADQFFTNNLISSAGSTLGGADSSAANGDFLF